jgi:hypothetical protein
MKQMNHMQQTPILPSTGLPVNSSNQMKLFGDMAQFLVAVAAASSSSNASSSLNNQATMSTKCPKSASSLSSPNANLFNSITSFQFPPNLNAATSNAPTTQSLSPNTMSNQAAALAAAYKYTSSLYTNLQQQQQQQQNMINGTTSLPSSDLLTNMNAQKQQLHQSYTASLMKYMSYYYSNGALANANSANKSIEYVQRLLAEQQAAQQHHMDNQMLIDCNNSSSLFLPNPIPTTISPISHKSSQNHGKQNHRFHPYSKNSIDSLNKLESNKKNKKAQINERCSPAFPTSPCSAFSATTSNHIAFKSSMKKQQNYHHIEQQQQCASSPTSRSTTPTSPNTTIDSYSIHMSNDGSIEASRVLTADDQ